MKGIRRDLRALYLMIQAGKMVFGSLKGRKCFVVFAAKSFFQIYFFPKLANFWRAKFVFAAEHSKLRFCPLPSFVLRKYPFVDSMP